MKVYWIRNQDHDDVMTQGYVGITSDKGRVSRLWGHFNNLKNKSHPNAHLQCAYNRYKHLESEILFEGTEEECVAKEIELRPHEGIGWNILAGGGLPPSHKGKHWITNGQKSTLSYDCPEGWRPGRIVVSGEKHGHYGKPKNYQLKGLFQKGHVVPAEHREKWIQSMRGVPKSKVTCPHCNLEGGSSAMKRWHFDNCKEKK